MKVVFTDKDGKQRVEKVNSIVYDSGNHEMVMALFGSDNRCVVFQPLKSMFADQVISEMTTKGYTFVLRNDVGCYVTKGVNTDTINALDKMAEPTFGETPSYASKGDEVE